MDALAPEDAAAAANDPLLENSDSVQDDGSGADAPVRFRTGNPSVQQWRGKVRAANSTRVSVRVCPSLAFIRLGERRPCLTLIR